MKHFFDTEYENLRRHIITMGTEVEQQVYRSIEAALNFDERLADQVIAKDNDIDKMEIENDDLCVRLFAKLQPIASDLRFITSVIKINNDFERISDQAVSIARHTLYLVSRPRLVVDLVPMATLAKDMVHRTVDALVNNNTDFAENVLLLEERMDKFEVEYTSQIVSIMKEDPKNIKRGISLLFITRCLERIGDLSTNIAEDIVFYTKAKDIRHLHPDTSSRSHNMECL
ncbi:MAG: phosphate signaling complex protein PhoU [Fibrobacteres bacterium]|nr:phosphate signaling complex protein PhoU [Fibrobacterota bacterium]